MEITEAKTPITERLRNWLLEKLGGVDRDIAQNDAADAKTAGYLQGHETGRVTGYEEGVKQCKVAFAVLPLPFTAEQLMARNYGEFITPVGFGTAFGECNIPAPGPHGYEQRAYYVNKHDLDLRPAEADLRCHMIGKFDDPANSDELVPVIVTVLRT